MGFLTRMLIPRSVRKAAHPVRTARRAATPKAVRQLQHAAHPISNVAYGAERALNTKRCRTARRLCRTCGEPLPKGAPGGQRYCGPACKP